MIRTVYWLTAVVAGFALVSDAGAEPTATGAAAPATAVEAKAAAAPAVAKPAASVAGPQAAPTGKSGAAKPAAGAAPAKTKPAAAASAEATAAPKKAAKSGMPTAKPATGPRAQPGGATTTASPPKSEPDPRGVLSAEELALDCRRMAGRMQVRILELRGGGPSKGASEFAQSLQSTVVPIIGGTSRGMSDAGDRSRDLTKLGAMNALLKQKNCPAYDLDAELAKPHSGSTPKLIRPGKAR